MFGEAYTIEDPAGTVRLTVRGTEAGVEPPALVLEVLLTRAADHGWSDALTPFEKRFELLHGTVEINGAQIERGERTTVPAGVRAQLARAVEAQLVCDLKPAGDPLLLAESLGHAFADRPARSWRAAAALALCAAVLVGLAVGHRPATAHGAPAQGAAWAQHLHLGGATNEAR
jgi:hypothetical protein